MNGMDYETMMALKKQYKNIFQCVTQEFENGDAIFDPTQLGNGQNIITRDKGTQVFVPENIQNEIRNIRKLTCELGIEIPFYLIGNKHIDYLNGDTILINRIILPIVPELFVSNNACSHDWIVPFLEGREELKPEDLKKSDSQLCIFQGHTHPKGMPGSNYWSVRDLTSIRFMQTEMNLPLTHSLLITPESGIKILDIDFKNRQTIACIEKQMCSSPMYEGAIDKVTVKKDIYGNMLTTKTIEGEKIPVPEYHFQKIHSREILG